MIVIYLLLILLRRYYLLSPRLRTDWNGYYARKLNLITDLGRFLDPLADKLLVAAALIALVNMQIIPAWIAVIILSREVAVTGLRLIAVKKGIVIEERNRHCSK